MKPEGITRRRRSAPREIRLRALLLLRAALALALPVLLASASPSAPASPGPKSQTRAAQDAGTQRADPTVTPATLRERAFLLDYGGAHEESGRLYEAARRLAPEQAASHLGLVEHAYWLHMYDEVSSEWDASIREGAETALALAQGALAGCDCDATAHLEAGLALLHLARLDGTRGRFLAAGRQGERARGHLERALALRPDLLRAKLALGQYAYYSSLLPDSVRAMSWLWFIPKGDRSLGLRYLEAVAASGAPIALEAELTLMNIWTYHGPIDPERALDLATRLHERFPGNAWIHFELLQILLDLGRDERLEIEARVLESHPGTSLSVRGRVRMARIWRARAALARREPDRARNLVATLDASSMYLPSWGHGWLHVVRGQIQDSLGDRPGALAQYRAALDLPGPSPESVVRQARAGLAAPFAASPDPLTR